MFSEEVGTGAGEVDTGDEEVRTEFRLCKVENKSGYEVVFWIENELSF